MNPADIQTPTSPLGNFPELAQMYQSSFQLPLSNATTGSQANQDQITVSNAKAAASAAASKSNYQAVKRADGGFGFYDPSGKEISANDYAAATGKNVSDVLKNSTNPIDVAHAKDFADLQSYISNKLQAKTNPGAAAKAKDVESQIYNNKDLTKINNGTPIRLGQMTPDQLIQTFQHAYPTVYGFTNTGVPNNQVFIPQSRI